MEVKSQNALFSQDYKGLIVGYAKYLRALVRAAEEERAEYDESWQIFFQPIEPDVFPSLNRLKHFLQVLLEEQLATSNQVLYTLILISRLVQKKSIPLNRYSWRSFMLVMILLTQKMLQDKAVNMKEMEGIVDTFDLQKINSGECLLFRQLQGDLLVHARVFNTIYFSLREPKKMQRSSSGLLLKRRQTSDK